MRKCRSETKEEPAAEEAIDGGKDDRSAAPEEAPSQSGRSTRRSSVAMQPALEPAASRPARGRSASLAGAAEDNTANEVLVGPNFCAPVPGNRVNGTSKSLPEVV